MSTLVIPGQPLTSPTTSAMLQAGPGTYSRGGTIYAALRGKVVTEAGVSTIHLKHTLTPDLEPRVRLPTIADRFASFTPDRPPPHRQLCLPRDASSSCSPLNSLTSGPQTVSVVGKDDAQTIPTPNSIVIGTVSRVTRVAATLSLLTVDGKTCRPEFQGVIRAQDVRQTAKDSVKVSATSSVGGLEIVLTKC